MKGTHTYITLYHIILFLSIIFLRFSKKSHIFSVLHMLLSAIHGEKGDMDMQLDKKSLDKLLMLNDDQLRRVMAGLLSEYGVDPSTVPLHQFDMGKLRGVLANATDQDIQRFTAILSGGKSTGDGR